MRRKGVRVAAVFMGENANVPNARAIYGQDLAPIRRMDQLSAAAGRLIQRRSGSCPARINNHAHYSRYGVVVLFPCSNMQHYFMVTTVTPFSPSP